MTIQTSVSSKDATQWLYTRPAFGRTGRSVADNNFAKEKRDWIAILLREILQNGLDARASLQPVTVRIKEKEIAKNDVKFVESILPAEHLSRLSESMPHMKIKPPEIKKFLVVEDFGTTGLTGETNNPNLDKKGENWNAFWFREGEGGKEKVSSNGGAGQGKITYFSTSEIRTIFAFSVRVDDGKGVLFGASSFLRDYDFGGERWLRDSYWGISWDNGKATIALPSEDKALRNYFRNALGVTRTDAEPGLSLLIASPSEFSIETAVEVVVAEFFKPILRGDLILEIGGMRIDSDSIVSIADKYLSDERARSLHTCTTKGYRQFMMVALSKSKAGDVVKLNVDNGSSKITEESFNSEDLIKLRQALVDGGIISVRCALTISPRGEGVTPCYFDVHLSRPDDLDEIEQVFIRKDLLIGEEPFSSASLRQRARGLTLIEDDALSRLLLSAEEATHLRWNTRLPRLREYYRAGESVVSTVRNTMAKILDVVVGAAQERDFKALAKFFPIPGAQAKLKTRGKKIVKKEGDWPLPNDVPPPLPKKILFNSTSDGCLILPRAGSPFIDDELPVLVRVEFAYEGLDNDAFAEYDPFDFDVSGKEFKIFSTGCVVTSRNLNFIEFEIASSDFDFKLSGFDENLRLRAKLKYTEANNGANVDAE